MMTKLGKDKRALNKGEIYLKLILNLEFSRAQSGIPTVYSFNSSSFDKNVNHKKEKNPF